MPEQLPQNYTEEVTPEKTRAEKHAHDQDPVTPTDVNDTPKHWLDWREMTHPLVGLEGNMETLPSPEPRCSGGIRNISTVPQAVNFFFSFLFFSKKSLL